MRSVDLRTLAPDDCQTVARLARDGFTPRLQPYMVHTQIGAENYLRDLCQYPNLAPDYQLLVATDGSEILGYAEFRHVGQQDWHLSYIAVSSLARGRGVATSLIEGFAEQHQASSIQLDVFSDNQPARALYAKRGFAEVGGSKWWTQGMPPARAADLQVRGLSQSLSALARLGFCELRGVHDDREFRLGMLGTSIVRCYDCEHLRDADLMGALRGSFPALSKGFWIGQIDSEPPSELAELINTSLRLRKTYRQDR